MITWSICCFSEVYKRLCVDAPDNSWHCEIDTSDLWEFFLRRTSRTAVDFVDSPDVCQVRARCGPDVCQVRAEPAPDPVFSQLPTLSLAWCRRGVKPTGSSHVTLYSISFTVWVDLFSEDCFGWVEHTFMSVDQPGMNCIGNICCSVSATCWLAGNV